MFSGTDMFTSAPDLRMVFGCCEPHLLPMYLKMGQRTYAANNINSPTAGYLIPLVAFVPDIDALRGVGAGTAPDELPPSVREVLDRGGSVRSEALTAHDDYWGEIRQTLDALDAQQIAAFDGFSDDEARRCIERSTIIECAAGDRVLTRGGTARSIFVVLSGTLEAAIELAETIGVDPPWGALQALKNASQWRRDPAAHRRWHERCHRLDIKTGDPYRRIVNDATRANCADVDEHDQLIVHYEKLTVEAERFGDPLLKSLAAHGFFHVHFRAGQFEQACARIRAALDPDAGPAAYSGALWYAAAGELLGDGGDLAWARTSTAEALRIAHDEGLGNAIRSVQVAAALAAERADLEAAAVLLGAAARHIEPLAPVNGDEITSACIELAQAAIDAAAFDRTTVQRQIDTMTLDDLITRALESLA